MPTLVLRLYGRFAYAVAHTAENAATGEISAIAPKFNQPFNEHRPLMSIPRNAIALGPDAVHGGFLTDVPPMLKVVSDQADVLDGELFIWDLDGHDVSFGSDASAPSASLILAEKDRVIPDIGALMAEIGHESTALDPTTLSAANTAKVQAVVKITQGKGTARMAIETDEAFLIAKGVADENPTPTPDEVAKLVSNEHNRRPADGTIAPFKKADVVDFEIDISRNVPFTFTLTNPVKQEIKKVSVMATSSDDRILVNFSNLCSTIPREETYDLEFFQYYNLLKGSVADAALVLLPVDDGGEPGECQTMARIDYRPNT